MRFEKGFLLKANTYYFDSIDEFHRNKVRIETTPHSVFSLSERITMAGLAYIVFLHRLSFNLEDDNLHANIADMNGGQNFASVSLSNLVHSGVPLGITGKHIISQTKDGKMTLGKVKLIYRPGDLNLYLDGFEHYDKMRERRQYKGGGFNLPDNIGFS